MEDEFDVPSAVQDAANAYTKSLSAKNRAVEKFNAAKGDVIESMRDEGLDRVRVQTDRGEKWLTVTNEDKLKLEKISENSDD